MFRALILSVLLLAACSPAGPARDDPPDEPESTSAPYSVSVADVTYTSETSLGGTIQVIVALTNAGSAENPATQLQFSDIDEYADIVGCDPECELTKFFGDYALLPGVPANESVTYEVQFVASQIGAVQWGLCVYDDEAGEQIYCGSGTTVIR